MNRYLYDGPVMEFNTCISNRWKASTYATSESKARSNIAYQIKKACNKAPTAKITLPGKICIANQAEEIAERG